MVARLPVRRVTWACTRCSGTPHGRSLRRGGQWELQKPHAHARLARAAAGLGVLRGPGLDLRDPVEGRIEHLGEAAVDLERTGRGGEAMYHAPGQVVGYPILHLRPGERDVRAYVWRIEELLIRTVADFGVSAGRVEGLRGIWVDGQKIAAIGVRLSRWTTMHGFALNVSTDLSGFGLIVPCGIRDREVTSLERVLGTAPRLEVVLDRLTHHAAQVLGRFTVPTPATALSDEAA